MGWEALKQWGDGVARIAPLAGGVANNVWRVRANGHPGRLGRFGPRSDADLAWETELLQYLDRAGLTVPVPIRSTPPRRSPRSAPPSPARPPLPPNGAGGAFPPPPGPPASYAGLERAR